MYERMPVHCPRCAAPLTRGWSVSLFSVDVICLQCKLEEPLLPNFLTARTVEQRHVAQGDLNFAGIGLDHLDRATIAALLLRRERQQAITPELAPIIIQVSGLDDPTHEGLIDVWVMNNQLYQTGLFSFNPDQVQIVATELLGLTHAEARALYQTRVTQASTRRKHDAD